MMFNIVVLRVVYNTNRPVTGVVKDATPAHKLSNVVYMYICHCVKNYIACTSQRFHDRSKKDVTKNLKKLIFDGESRPKGEQLSVHEQSKLCRVL